MSKRQVKSAFSLTRRQARFIASYLCDEGINDDNSIGMLLLLLRALVYTGDATYRENLLIELEAELMPLTRSACGGLDALIEERKRTIREATKG